MDTSKCAKCGQKVYEDLIFVPGMGWVCQDCAIDEEDKERVSRLEAKIFQTNL